MNIAWDWLHGRSVETLGWTLIHSLWELTIINTAVAIVLALMRRQSANARYLVSCAGMLCMVGGMATTYVTLLPKAQEPIETIQPIITVEQPIAPMRSEVGNLPPISITSQVTAPPRSISWRSALQSWLPVIVATYIIGIFTLSARLLGGYWQLRHICRCGEPVTGKVKACLADLEGQLGLRQHVRLLQSALVEVPTVIGAWRPVILLPLSAITGLTQEQLSALLTHELAHIRRHDYLVNAVQCVLETLFFYHPAVWWLSARIRQERENCCDDIGVAVTGSRYVYAEALTAMESLRAAPGIATDTFAIAASGGSLLLRIRRLLGVPPRKSHGESSLLVVLIAFGLIAITAFVYVGCNTEHAQQTAPLSEVKTNTIIPSTQPELEVAIEARALLVSPTFLDDFRFGWDINIAADNGNGPPSTWPATIIDNWTLNLLLNSTQSDRRTRTITAPRLTVKSGRQGDIRIHGNALNNFKLFYDVGAVPLKSVSLAVKPTISADRKHINMSIWPALIVDADGNWQEPPSDAITTLSIPDGGTLLMAAQKLIAVPEVQGGGSTLSTTQGADKVVAWNERRLLILMRPNIIIHREPDAASSAMKRANPSTTPASQSITQSNATTQSDGSLITGHIIPSAGLMVFPDNWPQLPRKCDATTWMQESDANKAIREKLEGKIPALDVTDQSLEKVISIFREKMDAHIFVNWPELQGAGVEKSTTVTLTLKDVPFGKALKMVLAQAGGEKTNLDYTIDDGIIIISSREDLTSEKYQLVRVFDIRGLLTIPPQNPPASQPGRLIELGALASLQLRQHKVQVIIDQIQTTIAPDTWRDRGGKIGFIRELNGQLIINQLLINQDAIFKLLEKLRADFQKQAGTQSAPHS